MQEFVGFDANAMVYNRQYEIVVDPPAITTVEYAFVSGMRPTVDGNFLEQLAGGAFDSEGRIIDAALQPRSDGRQAVQPDQRLAIPADVPSIPAAVFGGIVFDHFGHFLLETSARLWALPEYRSLPWIFLTDGRGGPKEYQLGFLELLGLERDRVIAVPDTLAVDQLVIPSPSFVYHHRVSHAYRDTFRRARPTQSGGRRRRNERVFLSRSQTRIALTVGEHELEDALRHDGWNVVVPETRNPAEQARLFQDDNLLLGLQGSAMHLGLFAPPGRRVVHLCRGQGYRGYYILDDLMDADATYLQAMSEPALRSKPITGPFLLDLDRTIGFLRERGLMGHAPVPAARIGADPAAMLSEYEAWWHFTESQIRFHRHLADDGAEVAPDTALPFALQALAMRPGDRDMLNHALALTLKFGTAEEADALLDRHVPGLGAASRPDDAPLLHFRSLIRDRQGDFDGALAAADAALALVPDHPGYVNQQATALLRLGRLTEAEATLRPLIAAERASAANHMLLSLILDRGGDTAAATEAARAAVRIDRHDEAMCRHLVGLLNRVGDEGGATAALEQFLDRNQGSADLLLQMARIDDRRGRRAEASRWFERAWAREPDNPVIRTAYLSDLTRRGLFPDLAFLGRPVTHAVSEQSVLIYHRSLALAGSNRHADALAVGVIAVELDPGNRTIMQNLLGLMLRMKRPGDAKLLIERLVEAGRESGEIFYVLSLAEGDLGNATAARQAAQRAAELAPANDMIVEHHRRICAGAA